MSSGIPVTMVEAARTGGPREIEALLQAAWPDAYRLALAILGQKEPAEDAAQEACIAMFRSVGSLRRADAFRTWSYRIIVREALKQKKLRVAEDASGTAFYEEDPSSSLDLWRALNALPFALRTAVVLHYFESLSTPEIGAILGIPQATVRFRLFTARRRLQHLLSDTAQNARESEKSYAL